MKDFPSRMPPAIHVRRGRVRIDGHDLAEDVPYTGVIFGSQICLTEHIQRFQIIRLRAMGRFKIMCSQFIAIKRECVESGKFKHLERRRFFG